MATMVASPGVSSANLLAIPRLVKGLSLIVGIQGFAAMRCYRGAATSSSAFCSTSRGFGFHTRMIGKAALSIGTEDANVSDANKHKQNLAVTTKSARRPVTRTAASRQQYNMPQQSETVPLWLWICLALFRTVKDALQFLWEQPGQLKDIEWPSFQSTIRMAVLTVVVVAFLIIFLATVDSTFSYMLSSILRRVP